MADSILDLGTLPDEVREKLAELDLELSEGMCKTFASIQFILTCILNSIHADPDNTSGDTVNFLVLNR